MRVRPFQRWPTMTSRGIIVVSAFLCSPREGRQAWYSWASQCAPPPFPPSIPRLWLPSLSAPRSFSSWWVRTSPISLACVFLRGSLSVGCRCWNIAQWACFNEHSRAVSCHPSLPLANSNHSTVHSVHRERAFLFYWHCSVQHRKRVM